MKATSIALAMLLLVPAAGAGTLTWETLAERMDREVAGGFSGALLVVRDGKIVHNEGYGLADRDRKVPVTPDTVFAIGSIPMDFTKAAILRLEQDGKLSTSDPVTRFFDDVPAGKRSLTIAHILEERSGLQDFHHGPGDPHPDHAWIDRDEAVRRILSMKLKFTPGARRAPSHSAYGLLAAIVEVASGKSYADYLRETFFEPAGMTRTGFYGEERFGPEAVAVGYDDLSHGKVNSPPHWGPTSWLVMGSGGMVSTTGDLHRWTRAMRDGKFLSEEAQARYWSGPGTLLAGGDSYGFEAIYNEGPGSQFFLMSNSSSNPKRQPKFMALGRDLMMLTSTGGGKRVVVMQGGPGGGAGAPGAAVSPGGWVMKGGAPEGTAEPGESGGWVVKSGPGGEGELPPGVTIETTDDGGTIVRRAAPVLKAPYRIGLMLDVQAEHTGEMAVTVMKPVPGGPSDKAGLLPGDRITGFNGSPIDREPLDILDGLLKTGKPITFNIERAGEAMDVVVTPEKVGS